MAKRRRVRLGAFQVKRVVRCAKKDHRFTVVQVDGDPGDTHAARSFEQAFRLANPDRGSKIAVYATCAQDVGQARLYNHFRQRGSLVRAFIYRGGR